MTINYKDYRNQKPGKPPPQKTMSFEGTAFLQRLTQHFMPYRFHKVRYYGFYSFSAKKLKASILLSLTGQVPKIYQKPSSKELIKRLIGLDPDICQQCGVVGAMVTEKLLGGSTSYFRLTHAPSNLQIRAGPRRDRHKEAA